MFTHNYLITIQTQPKSVDSQADSLLSKTDFQKPTQQEESEILAELSLALAAEKTTQEANKNNTQIQKNKNKGSQKKDKRKIVGYQASLAKQYATNVKNMKDFYRKHPASASQEPAPATQEQNDPQIKKTKTSSEN